MAFGKHWGPPKHTKYFSGEECLGFGPGLVILETQFFLPGRQLTEDCIDEQTLENHILNSTMAK